MRRPTFKPSQEIVPTSSTLMPNRCCKVSSSGSVPSSIKEIGLIWIPTNLAGVALIQVSQARQRAGRSPVVPSAELPFLYTMLAAQKDVLYAADRLDVFQWIAVQDHEIRQFSCLDGAESVGIATQFGTMDRQHAQDIQRPAHDLQLQQ